jgi:hypothetical protein
LACPVPIAIGKHRAGLDFFGSFCIKAKRTSSFFINFMFFLLLVQKKERKKSTPAMIYGHCRPDSYRD